MSIFGDYINPIGSAIMSGGGNYLLGGDLMNPTSGITDRMGYQNPNSTAEGQALLKQKGDTVTWGDTAALANDRLGTNINAPQAAPIDWMRATTQNAGVTNANAAAMNAATMNGAQLDTRQADQARANQNALVSSLQGTAAGQGPSVAQEQLRQATNQNINQQMSAAQSAHGAARLAALRNAGMTGAQTQQLANSQAAQLRAQEIASAQSNLGNALGLQRGQDVTTAAQNAQLAQQTGATNAGFQQAANATNAGFQQGVNQQNAGAANTAALANADAWNRANQLWATQANAGNLGLAQSNLTAQLGTNNLNTQRGIAQVNAAQGAAQGQTGIGTTMYGGTADYNKDKREQGTQMAGNLLNNVGGLSALGGLL